MADRFPLIVDSSTQRVKELPSGDNLDLTGSSIVNAGVTTFSGKLTVNNQSEIYRPAAVGGSTSGNTLLQLKSDVGGTAVTKVSMTTDGAATFAGDGHFKCGGTAHADMGVQFINDGEVKIYRPTGGGGTVNLISGSAGVGSPSEQFAIKADGSASFAVSNVDIAATGQITIKKTAPFTDPSFRILDRNNSNANGVLMYGDGSANFATHLITGSANSITSTSAHGSYIGEGVVVNAIQPNATLAGQERVWLGKLANVTKSQIFKDGSATFAGPQTLATPSSPATNGYTSHVDNNEASTAACYSANNHNAHGINFLGVDGGNSNAITCKIMNDGSATFASTVNTGSWPNNASTSTGGGAYLARQDTSTSVVWKALSGGTGASNVTSQILADGSATFAGLITANGNIVSDRTSGSNTCFQATLNGSTKATINANGSATFDGGMVAKQEVYVQGTTTSTQRYLNFQDSGTSNYRATLRRDAWYLGSPVTNIGDVTPSGANIVLNMNGSATFNSSIQSGEYAAGAAGSIQIFNNTASAQAFKIGNTTNGSNIAMKSDGSATFAARVDAGAITLDSNLTPTSGTSIEAFYGSTGGVIQAYDRDNGNWEPLRVKGSNWTIDHDGTATFGNKVLIGTTTEGYTTSDDLTIATSGSTGMTIRSGTSNYGSIHFSDATSGSGEYAGVIEYNHTNNSLGFYANASERARITSSGTSYFRGDSNAVWAFSGQSAGTSFRLFYGAHSAGTDFSGGTSVYTVWTNGNVVNANNSYGSLSDAKLKENIVDASSQWNDIKDLRVRNYNFIEGQTHTQIGVVAQEVETVSPGLVYESPDTDEEGNDLGTTTKSVNYSVLYMKSVKALQEAMDRIETLEAKVAALEAG